jgi:hypothetical protein
MSDNKNYDGWIFAIVITLYGWFIHSVLSKIVPSLFKTKEENCSNGYSSFLNTQDDDYVGSISNKFEEMCIHSPLLYKNSPELKQVIKDYGDIIKGRRLDPDGIHMPSLMIDGEENPDYYRYLRNQKRSLKKAGDSVGWITEEMSRVTAKKNSDDIESEFAMQLLERGLPSELIPYILTYERLENYEPSDWDALIKTVKAALNNECDINSIVEFLELMVDAEHYESSDLLEDYCTLRGHDAPKTIAVEFCRGRLSEDQALTSVALVQKGYGEDEAMLMVLEQSKNEIESEDLKNLYRSKI